MVFHNLIN
jgi:hypothetical protein